MAKKTSSKISELPFYSYLLDFYKSNYKTIKKEYKPITRKFLDFNNPENGTAFLRIPQFEALEIYIFLKEYLENPYLQDVFKDWYDCKNKFEGRNQQRGFLPNSYQTTLFESVDSKVFEQSFNTMTKFRLSYPNYIFALSMGIGKTILMATCIFYEFLLANKFPKDEKYCHNVLVFAPDKTVLQSLKEIQEFDKNKVVPPEYINWLETHIQFHFLDETGISLNLIDESKYNIIISNTQKIILKKQHKEQSPTTKLFTSTSDLLEEFSDLYEEKDLLENQRFQKLTRLSQLGIYLDEGHHAYGTVLEKDFGIKKSATSLRVTINELSSALEEAGTHIVACYNYTGTPYLKDMILPDVVYSYGLREAIDNKYLKKASITDFKNIKSNEFIDYAVKDFWTKYNGKTFEGMLPKIAFYASTIDELQNELKPALEETLSSLNIPLHKILVNVGEAKLTSNDDIREFIHLDSVESEKQFILLVGKGKEGWNCRSLFSVALFRKPKSKIFVLQSTMRCMRSIGNIQETASVYLSNENKSILESELQDNYRMSIQEFKDAGDDREEYEVKVKIPPKKIKFKRVKKLYNQNQKEVKEGIDLELHNIDVTRYELVRTETDIRHINSNQKTERKITEIRENYEYTDLTLVYEISKYLNMSCKTIKNVLTSSKDGIDKIIETVNKHNEVLFDYIIPRLFNEFFEIEEYNKTEEIEVDLIKEPKDGTGVYRVKAKPELVANMTDEKIKNYSEKSFHVDKYCFDSNPEFDFFWLNLTQGNIKELYFTGMFTSGQSDFSINYIDPESHTLRRYYPDFLLIKEDGSYVIVEIKADNHIDDEVVKAKQEYAREMAQASNMIYEMIPATKAGITKY